MECDGDFINYPTNDAKIESSSNDESLSPCCQTLLELKEKEWEEEKKELEEQFNDKKVKFKSKFVNAQSELDTQKILVIEQNLQITKLKEELQESQTLLSVIECQHGSEIDSIKRRCEEDLASLRHIMKEKIEEALSTSNSEKKMDTLKKVIKNKVDISSLSKSSPIHKEAKENSLSRFKNKLVSPNHAPTENLEESMKKAQEDTQMIRALVIPLEEEIESLKDKLEKAEMQVKKFEIAFSVMGNSDSHGDKTDQAEAAELLDEKVSSLLQGLQAEKASRSDLEMYVAVLNTQKSVLQEDADRLEKELKEVCELLEQEKREHASLKRTWQMANDQFLETQRLQIRDMQNMQSVLTAEQQRQIFELQRKDEELEKERHATKHNYKSSSMASSSQVILETPDSEEIQTPGELRRSLSSSLLTEEKKRHRRSEETRSLVAAEELGSWKTTSLTKDQFKALADLTPELEIRRSMLENAKRIEPDLYSVVGRRLVSETEWQLLEDELRKAREKLGQPCEMCTNYEVQLQQIQNKNQEWENKLQLTQESLNLEREEQAKCAKTFLEEAKKVSLQRMELIEKINLSDDQLSKLKQEFSELDESTKLELDELRTNCYKYQQMARELRSQNEALLGKHIDEVQKLEAEWIDFPNNLEDLQEVCLKIREQLISTLLAKNQMEESLHSEVLFITDCHKAEQHAKATIEETLTHELDTLREQLVFLEGVKASLEKGLEEKNLISEKVGHLQMELSQAIKDHHDNSTSLTEQITQLSEVNAKYEEELSQLKIKIMSLQADLETSEMVQKDFVKLSQSLQMELEKIRQSDTELRWQNEEDFTECTSCQKNFQNKKEKLVFTTCNFGSFK